MVGYGACAAMVLAALLLYALLTLSWPTIFTMIALIACSQALPFGGIGIWMRSLQKHVGTLDTADQISARFGINEATLDAFAQDKEIKPRMSINGMDYYNPADFAPDALTLLRGTTRPNETQEVLLRPATADTSTAPEQLLRVPNGDMEEAQNVAPVALAPSYIQMETTGEQPLQEIQRQ